MQLIQGPWRYRPGCSLDSSTWGRSLPMGSQPECMWWSFVTRKKTPGAESVPASSNVPSTPTPPPSPHPGKCICCCWYPSPTFHVFCSKSLNLREAFGSWQSSGVALSQCLTIPGYESPTVYQPWVVANTPESPAGSDWSDPHGPPAEASLGFFPCPVLLPIPRCFSGSTSSTHQPRANPHLSAEHVLRKELQTGEARWALSIPPQPGAGVPAGHLSQPVLSISLRRQHTTTRALTSLLSPAAPKRGMSCLRDIHHHPEWPPGPSWLPAQGKNSHVPWVVQACNSSSRLWTWPLGLPTPCSWTPPLIKLAFVSPHCLWNLQQSPAQLPWFTDPEL